MAAERDLGNAAMSATVPAVPQPASRRTIWLFLVAVIALIAAAFTLLPNTPNVLAGFSLREVVYIELVFFAAGLTSGLAGFGFSGIGAASLVLFPPVLGTPLLQALSTANQVTSVGQLWKDMPRSWKSFWAGPGPYIIGGMPGSVLGIWLLTNLPAKQLMIMFGSLLLLYSIYSLVKPDRALVHGCDGPLYGGVVGFVGGTLGGFTAFPGAAVVVWSNLRNLSKERNRAIVQPYIIMSQIYALGLLAWLHPTIFSHKYWVLLALTLPAVLPGTATGVSLYRRISDINFRRITYFCLALSGAVLLLKVLLK
jgi:uncharacterized membrane protein YfcA